MSFAWPYLLWLLFLPAAWLAWDLRARRGGAMTAHPKIAVAEAGTRHVSLAPSRLVASRVRPWFCIGVACAIVALARPQWGRLEEPVFDQAREILIAVDLSRSMLTPDVKPSRLDRAKLLTQSLLEKLTGERVGLVVFSGTAFLQSPLSADYEILREFLPALGPEFLPEGGTNYRALIDTALSAFGASSSADRFLIILSDGEATEDNWRDRIDDLKAKGVRVIALGVGTTAGAMIPDGAGGLVKDERGAVVLSKLESGTLRELGDKTGGVYQDASSWIDLAGIIESTVEAGKKGQFTEKNTVRLVERFQWPLAIALWCLLVSAYYELPVRPKPRELKLRLPEAPPPAPAPLPSASSATLALFLLIGSVALLPVAAWAQTPASPPAATPPAPPLLSRIVGRLSAADERTARDWAEFGRETVTWGSRLQSSQQPVPEGPVRDALAAAKLGEDLDPKTTDWPKLREELEALLKKPEPPEQQQQKQDQQQDQDQKQDKQQKNDQQQKKDESRDPSSQQPQDPSQEKKDEQQGQPKPQEQQDKEQQSAFGDMKQPPPPPPQETQKVGGVPEKQQTESSPTDPALAVPMQKLEQLRNQDSPAELFKLMEAEKEKTPRTKTKDW